MKLPTIAAAIALLGLTLSASYAQILNDHFVSVLAGDQNANNGQYRNATSLNAATNNFVNGGSIVGFTSTNVWSGASANPRTVSTGLVSNSVASTGGAVEFRGANDNTNRMNYRQITGNTGPSSLYFTGSMSVSLIDDNAVSLLAFTSLGGDTRGDNILNNTGGFYDGLAFGFLGDNNGGMNLVVRYRDESLNYVDFTLLTGVSINTTYTVMGRIDWNTGMFGTRDPFTIWVNPQSLTEPVGGINLVGFLGDPSTINSVYLLQRSFGTGLSDAVYFDEIRLGSTWADLQPIPEPSMIAYVMAGFVAWIAILRHQRRKRNSCVA